MSDNDEAIANELKLPSRFQIGDTVIAAGDGGPRYFGAGVVKGAELVIVGIIFERGAVFYEVAPKIEERRVAVQRKADRRSGEAGPPLGRPVTLSSSDVGPVA